MFQTRAPAAGQGRGRSSLGRGRGRIPAADVPVTVEPQENVAESVASGTGNDIVERQDVQRAQPEGSDRIRMEGPVFRDYIRQVMEAARAGRPTPALPAQVRSFQSFPGVTQMSVIPARAAKINQV